AHPGALRCRAVGRAGPPRTGSPAAEAGRGDDAAGAGGADARGVLPVRARVLRGLRAQRGPAAAAARARGRAAPGPDDAGHGNRPVGRRFPARCHHPAGQQRCARPDGGALPPAGRRGGSRMSRVLLKQVRPYGEGDPVDLLVENGLVADIAPEIDADADELLHLGGAVVLPGFVDLHTHLREPGREDAETIETGSMAAALGGYTAVFAMANTDPVADNAVVVEHVWRRGRETGLVDVHPVGAVTVGLNGEQLAELGTMARSAAQVRVFSDDGRCVHDPLIMRRALEYTRSFGGLIAQHAEEPRLTVGAQAHEGANAARLGLAGWPAAA